MGNYQRGTEVYKRTKSYLKLVTPLMNSIMINETERMLKEREKLVIKNRDLGGSRHGFYYKGVRYSNEHPLFLKDVILPPVQEEFKPQVQDYLTMMEQLEKDRQFLKQGLGVVLARCKTSQDVRDVLPDSFLHTIPSLNSFQRTRTHSFIFNGDSKLQLQYEKAVEIAEYYTANLLIY